MCQNLLVRIRLYRVMSKWVGKLKRRGSRIDSHWNANSPSEPWWIIKSPVIIRSGTRGTACMPSQFVTVLKSFGPVILSQVVSFFFSGSAAMARFMFRACLNVCRTATVLRVVKEVTGWSTSMPMQDRKIESFIVVKMAWKSKKSTSLLVFFLGIM